MNTAESLTELRNADTRIDRNTAETKSAWAGHTIIWQDCVDSTNEEAKRGGDAGHEHGTVYCAKRQTAGKGRRGRSWLSESEENLYFTILLRPDMASEKISMLTLVMAYAVAKGIRQVTEAETHIKWPNDILIGNKKLCGILSEMKVENRKAAYCVIGVGINIGQTSFPEELKDKATSFCMEGFTVDAEELLRGILRAFEESYEVFMTTEDISPIMDEYNALLAGKGGMVRVLEPTGEYEGKSLGVNSSGELLVETTDGTVQQVYAGEVSVRGLYGYV